MEKLEFFARKYNLELKSSANGEYSICGREGRIRVIKGNLGVELYDQNCIPRRVFPGSARKAFPGFIMILLFNPDDTPAANLALELIETVGQAKLTTGERRKKVKLFRWHQESEILRSFGEEHGLKPQMPGRGPYQTPERGPYILGRAGSIFVLGGQLGIHFTDQSIVQDPVEDDHIFIPIFNHTDEIQTKLALELIEATGQKEFTRDEQKAKLDVFFRQLGRLERMNEVEEKIKMLTPNGYKDVEAMVNVADKLIKLDLGKKWARGRFGEMPVIEAQQPMSEIAQGMAQFDEVDRNLMRQATENVIDLLSEACGGRYKIGRPGADASGKVSAEEPASKPTDCPDVP
jgi:hypothetical protein